MKKLDMVGRFFFFCFLGMILLGVPLTASLWLVFDLFKVPQFITFWVGITLEVFAVLTLLITALYLTR